MPGNKEIQASIISGLLFLLVASPFMYKLVDRVVGRFIPIADANGCPTTAGLLIHSAVFAILTFGLMQWGKAQKKVAEPEPTPVAPAPQVNAPVTF